MILQGLTYINSTYTHDIFQRNTLYRIVKINICPNNTKESEVNKNISALNLTHEFDT